MTLIVEDGSLVTNSNSYISLADARTRATTLSITLNVDDTTAENQLERAALYVDRNYRARFQGQKTSTEQSMQWPRTNVIVDYCDYVDNDEIPQELIDAQVYAAAQLEADNTFYTNSDGRSVASEEVVGAVKVAYFNTGKTGSQIRFSDVQQTILPLLKSSSGLINRR